MKSYHNSVVTSNFRETPFNCSVINKFKKLEDGVNNDLLMGLNIINAKVRRLTNNFVFRRTNYFDIRGLRTLGSEERLSLIRNGKFHS